MVQLIWVVVRYELWAVTVAVVVGYGDDGRWWLSVLLPQWIFMVGGCAVDVVVINDNGGEDNILF